MNGMDARTGKPLAGEDHLRQSVADILATPIGSRVARREYGSLLPELIDQPANPATQMRIFAATALAILRWEPRLKLTGVALEAAAAAGSFRITLDGVRTDVSSAAARIRLVVPVGRRAATTL